MWKDFAGGLSGLCLAFDVPNRLIHRVKYSDIPVISPCSRRLIRLLSKERWSIEQKAELYPELHDHLLNLYATKFMEHSYEEELRAFVKVNDPPDKYGKWYVEFNGREGIRLRTVVLGSECALDETAIREIVGTFRNPVDVMRLDVARLSHKST